MQGNATTKQAAILIMGVHGTSTEISNHQRSQMLTKFDVGEGTMSEANLVRIGQKPVMNYVTACVTLFNSGNGEVMVRGRGQAIEKAIDTVQLLRRGFLKDVIIEKINLGSEDVTRYDGTAGNISVIEIILSRESYYSTDGEDAEV